MTKTLFAKAAHVVRKNIWLVVLSVVIDIFFLVSFGLTYSYLFVVTSVHLDNLNTVISEKTADFVATGMPTAMNMTDAGAEINAVLWGIAAILGTLYLLWSVTQGATWWIAHREEDRKAGLGLSLLRIFSLNLLWIVILTIILFGSVWLSVQSSLSPVPLLGPGAYQTLAGVLSLVLVYFMTVSYAHITHPTPLRTSLRNAVTRIASFGIPFIVAVLGLVLLGAAMVYLAPFNYLLGLLALVILLAWLALCRVWLCLAAHAR